MENNKLFRVSCLEVKSLRCLYDGEFHRDLQLLVLDFLEAYNFDQNRPQNFVRSCPKFFICRVSKLCTIYLQIIERILLPMHNKTISSFLS